MGSTDPTAISESVPESPIILRPTVPRLVQASFEGMLRPGLGDGGERTSVAQKDGGWTEEARRRGILIDLSKVQWCDLLACARLILIVERALRDQLPRVIVALPDPAPRPNERLWRVFFARNGRSSEAGQIERNQLRRAETLNFLRAIKFPEALECNHLPKVARRLRVLEDFGSNPEQLSGVPLDTSDETPPDPDFAASSFRSDADRTSFANDLSLSETRKSHPYTFLRWLPVDVDLEEVRQELEHLRDCLIGVVAHENRGIPEFAAEGFANVLFHELIENVRVHSGGASHCLVGIWAHHSGQWVFPDEYIAPEQPFFRDWVKANSVPLVEIILGDSGVGLVRTLGEAFDREPKPREGVPTGVENPELGTAFWALGRWSSSRQVGIARGTRGLHRVSRLARAYQGHLTIRTGTVLAGWDYGGSDERRAVQGKGLAWVPGTAVTVRFTATFRAEARPQRDPLCSRDVEYLLARPLEIDATGILKVEIGDAPHPYNESDPIDALCEILSIHDPQRRHCVIAFIQRIPHNPMARKTGFQAALEQLCRLPNPGALVLCVFGIDPKELSSYVESVNEDIGKEPNRNRWSDGWRQSYNPSNPFLILDRDRQTHWVGTCPWEIPLLRAMEAANGIELSEDATAKAIPDESTRRRSLCDFRQHEDLIKVGGRGGLALRFSSGDVTEQIVAIVGARLADSISKDPRRLGAVVRDDGPFLWPTLQTTRLWVDAAELVESFDIFQIQQKTVREIKGGERLLNALLRAADHQFFSVDTLAAELQEWKNTDGEGRTVQFMRLLRALSLRLGPPPLIHALALKIRAGLSQHLAVQEGSLITRPRFPHYVLRDSNSQTVIASGLNRFFGISGPPIQMPHLPHTGDADVVWEVIRDRNVLIYVDFLLSASTTNQLINQVILERGEPVGVACLCDFRSNGDNGKPIEDSGRHIPVFSVAQADDFLQRTFQEQPLRMLRVINALTGKLESRSDPGAGNRFPISEKQLSAFIIQTKALRFGHFVLPLARHFIFYLDAAKVFSSEESRNVTRHAVRDLVDSSRTVSITRLLPSIDQREPLLMHVSGEISPESAHRILGGDSVAIFRTLDGLSYEGISASTVRGRDVVAFVWNSHTGQSVTRLTYQLAEAGAGSVLVIVWLSRLDSRQEDVLHGWSEIQVPETPSTAELALEQSAKSLPTFRKVPVRIRFLTRAAIPVFSNYDCPICRQRDRIANELDRYPTEHLRQFAEDYVTIIRPWDHLGTTDDDDGSSESIGVECDPIRGTQMLAFRATLERMRTETTARLMIFEDLVSVRRGLGAAEQSGAAVSAATAFVSLLATEIDWFKDPPLCGDEARRLIADIALNLLRRSEIHESVQREAIIVLRAANKRLFAESVFALVNRFLSRPALIGQILYDCFTYLDKPYHQDEYHLAPIADSLTKVRDLLEQTYASDVASQDSRRLDAVAKSLANLAEERRFRLLATPDPRQAWRALRAFFDEQLRDAHHPLPGLVSNLDIGRLEKALERDRRPVLNTVYWRAVREKWERVRDILQREVFNRLRFISQYLDAPLANEFLRGGNVNLDGLNFLKELASGHGGGSMSRFTDLIDRFCKEPPLGDSKSWAEFKDLRELFGSMLLNAANRDGEGGARLYRYLNGCPCTVGATIAREMENERWEGANLEFKSGDDFGTLVFCHRTVVLDLLTEALSNALVFHRPQMQDEPALIHFELTRTPHPLEGEQGRDSKCLKLVIRNTGSDAEQAPVTRMGIGGRGLGRIREDLRSFGGELYHSEPGDWESFIHPWTYIVVATFPILE